MSEAASRRVFLVSTDSNLQQQLISFFEGKYELSIFSDWEICFQNIHQRPLIIFFEMTTDANWGFSFLDKMNDFDKNIPLAVIANKNNISSSRFLGKPNVCCYFQQEELTTDKLPFLMKNIEQTACIQNQLEKIETKIQHNYIQSIVYTSEGMRRVAQLIEKAAQTNITCYISGEKGTEKGTVACIIHYLSNRKNNPYIHFKISSFAPEDLEKEIFGFEKNNGQIQQKGKLEEAANGTLYLEDINLLPLPLQAKLVEAFQKKVFYRVGNTNPIAFNTRILVSTQVSLFEEMNAGNFSESLYYRLMGLPISIPPLRERGNDILLLCNKFIEKFSTKNNFEIKKLSKNAKKKIIEYSFPGNIIELKSIIERAIVLSENNIILEEDIEFVNAPRHLSFLDQNMTFEEYKSKIIHHYLSKYNNDIMLVSNKLDIGKSTIYRMLKSEKEKGKKELNWFNLF